MELERARLLAENAALSARQSGKKRGSVHRAAVEAAADGTPVAADLDAFAKMYSVFHNPWVDSKAFMHPPTDLDLSSSEAFAENRYHELDANLIYQLLEGNPKAQAFYLTLNSFQNQVRSITLFSLAYSNKRNSFRQPRRSRKGTALSMRANMRYEYSRTSSDCSKSTQLSSALLLISLQEVLQPQANEASRNF